MVKQRMRRCGPMCVPPGGQWQSLRFDSLEFCLSSERM